MTEFVEIDGSVLEGGGQILRNAVSFSAILGIPVRISKIRAGRYRPGLSLHHLKGIDLVGVMCRAKVRGGYLKSRQLEFIPGKLRGGHYGADTESCSSVSLLLQVALPCALLADGPVTLTLRGGTNVDMAPQIDTMNEVFLRVLRNFGADFELEILRRGYYPQGGGCVRVRVNPVRLFRSVDLTDFGVVTNIGGTSFVSGGLCTIVGGMMIEAMKDELGLQCEATIKCRHELSYIARDVGSSVIAALETSTGCVVGEDALGWRGCEPATVGANLGRVLADTLQSGACVDHNTQDQIILYMALATGRSVVRVGNVTLHTDTAIYVAELMTKAKFKIEQQNSEQNLIECTGIGFINEHVPAQ